MIGASIVLCPVDEEYEWNSEVLDNNESYTLAGINEMYCYGYYLINEDGQNMKFENVISNMLSLTKLNYLEDRLYFKIYGLKRELEKHENDSRLLYNFEVRDIKTKIEVLEELRGF